MASKLIRFPIPDEALDDRLATVGTSGSGKTYGVIGAMARLLKKSAARTIGIDPLGCMWGLRLNEDGAKPSGLKIAILGGPHGDMPLTENSGALVGEAVAKSAESCIIDLSEFPSKAAERRFMLAFLTSLYRFNKDPVHLVIDEADMWAPQRLMDKDGDAARLLGVMETIVRRGRIRGFIPWLITQRPAVLSKDVLSQADGIVAMKLTSSQDRDAIGAWIEGQADRHTGKEILASLPTKARGEGVLWIPGRGILQHVTFPKNATFDSSRAPRPGEKRAATALQPLDIGALKEKLSTVEAETKANDPRALKAEVARLSAELRKSASSKPVAKINTAAAEAAAHAAGVAEGWAACWPQAWGAGATAMRNMVREVSPPDSTQPPTPPKSLCKLAGKYAVPMPSPATLRTERQVQNLRAAASSPVGRGNTIQPAKQRILDALAWFESIGQQDADRDVLAFLADTSSRSSAYLNNISALRTYGLIEYPRQGLVALTEEGRAQANQPAALLTPEALQEAVKSKLQPALQRILSVAIGAYPKSLSRDRIAELAGTSPTSSAFLNNVSRLRSLGFLDYPAQGEVAATGLLFLER
jgi:hypothetical protein